MGWVRGRRRRKRYARSPVRLALAPTLIATHSGLRGRPGVDLTPEVVDAVAGGLVALLEADALPLTVAVARDDRRGGLELARQVVDSLTRRGADVVELGAVSTPTAKLAARRGRLGAAIVVTGSHLEPDWNGLKLSLAPDFLPLDVRELPPPAEEAAQLGEVVQDSDAARIHVEAILATVDVERIRRRASFSSHSGARKERYRTSRSSWILTATGWFSAARIPRRRCRSSHWRARRASS